MQPTVSKELRKATDNLKSKMLIMQKVEAEMLDLKSRFVNASNPATKEKLKPVMIAKHTELKAAEKAADIADAEFHRLLANEPEEDYDLLDHQIKEHLMRLKVRKIVRESLQNI